MNEQEKRAWKLTHSCTGTLFLKGQPLQINREEDYYLINGASVILHEKKK